MSGGSFGSVAGGIGNLVGAAGDIYSLFNSPKQPKSPNRPFTGLIQTPGYNFGGGILQRKNDDFLTGMRRLRDIYGQQRSEVRPGFGRLTEAGVGAIRQRAAQAAGNLRGQLGRRGLLGASFAEDQRARLDQEYQQAENEFRTQAWAQEMQATNELLDREYTTLVTQASQELGELGTAAGFLAGVPQVAQTQKSIEAALKQLELFKQLGPPPEAPATPAQVAAPAATPTATTPKPTKPKKAQGFGGWGGGGKP